MNEKKKSIFYGIIVKKKTLPEDKKKSIFLKACTNTSKKMSHIISLVVLFIFTNFTTRIHNTIMGYSERCIHTCPFQSCILF